jgi:hypothetical protein
MSLSTTMPIFPGFKPGQSFTPPTRPVRSPMWNYIETAKWNNSRQQAINGRVSLIKYWINPLWTWEWTYGYLYDDPSGGAYGLGLNPFYPQPIPATDKGILQGFYNATGGGSLFAYQPPDSVQGGSMTPTSVVGVSDIFTIYGANTARQGQIATFSGLTGATFLNSQNLTILACSPLWIQVYFSHANYPQTADSGSVFCGQLLNVDGNLNAEITHPIGAYPTLPLSGTPPTYTLVNESVQLIDCSTLVVTAEGGSVPSYTLEAADTISPYQGLVINFASAPSNPITVSFNYYYACRFSEDTLEMSNFMTALYACSKFSFEQDRL